MGVPDFVAGRLKLDLQRINSCQDGAPDIEVLVHGGDVKTQPADEIVQAIDETGILKRLLGL